MLPTNECGGEKGIVFVCSLCGRRVRAPAPGSKGRCPHCGALNRLPEPSEMPGLEPGTSVREESARPLQQRSGCVAAHQDSTERGTAPGAPLSADTSAADLVCAAARPIVGGPRPGPPGGQVASITALVLGLFTLAIGWVPAIGLLGLATAAAGIVFGLVAVVNALTRRSPVRRSITGLAVSTVGLTLTVLAISGSGLPGLGGHVRDLHREGTAASESRSPVSDEQARKTKAAWDQQARATKAAWDNLNRADVHLATTNYGDRAEMFSEYIRRCADIDTGRVDQDLREFISDRVRLYDDARILLVQYAAARGKISQSVDDAAQLGAALGSTDSQDPDRSARAAAMFFGGLRAAGAQGEMNDLDVRFTAQWEQFQKQGALLDARKINLATTLSSKYGIVFEAK